MIDVPDSPVFAELQRQLSIDTGDMDDVNLGLLWEAAGRPRGKSALQWDARSNKEERRVENFRGYLLGDEETGLDYAQYLDPRIQIAVQDEFMRRLKADPARQMLGCPNPLMALFAVPAVMQAEGVAQDEAKARLVSEVVERTADLNPLEQETKVARVQRALRGEPDPEEPPRRQTPRS